jgi:hypothetical protein
MNRESYIAQIRETYPNEDPNDVFVMMEILAEARADARGASLSSADFEFAGKILCVIFDPIKFTIVGFSDQMQSLRRAYRGIAGNPQTQATFKESLQTDLVSAQRASEAIKSGVDALFRLPATHDES